MAKLTTVATERNSFVFDVASRLETLYVLFGARRPALCHLCAARFGRQLDGEDKLAISIANQVDNGHVLRELLNFFGNEEDAQIILTESFLDFGKIENLNGGASIGA